MNFTRGGILMVTIKNRIWILFVFVMVFFISTLPALAQRDPLVQLLIKKGIITEQEIAQMEKELAQTPGKEEAPRVDLAKAASKLKIKGRAALGYFDSGESGSYPSGSFEVPEAKIQFGFEPDKYNTFILRANLNNAVFNNLDYFYLDSKDFLPFLEDKPVKLSSRIGRFKLDLGEETWSNNSVEGALISNSAANTSGSDEGIQIGLNIGDKKRPLKVTGAITNGVTGVGSDTTGPKAFTGKIAYRFSDPFYVSTSYHHSGDLKASNSEASIGGLVSRPTNALKWDRQVWEIDARYDLEPGKTIDPPAYTDSLAYLRLAYGQFYDNAQPVADRDGNYGFVEGLWNITDKIYAAHRSSFIDLDGDTTAAFNSVTANKYTRYSFGLGYRLTDATLLKTEYSINRAGKATTGDPNDDQFATVISATF